MPLISLPCQQGNRLADSWAQFGHIASINLENSSEKHAQWIKNSPSSIWFPPLVLVNERLEIPHIQALASVPLDDW